MYQKLIFGILGGLGMFLFGMKIMSEGIQKIAGDKMRKILEALTNNRIMGLLVGLVITSIIQSSSATTVMVVGFVNAGLMNLMQSIGVIFGANIGTTVTGQIMAFQVHKYALPILGLGVLIRLFSTRKKWTYIGEATLGFGLLFYGLIIMGDTLVPLKDSPTVVHFFKEVGDNPFMGVMVGMIVTFVVQSSSATVGMTIVMGSAGFLTYQGAVALVLGENIGTTITAILASVGTNTNAKRAATVHSLFNIFGVCYMMLILPYFLRFVDYVTPGDPNFIDPAAVDPSMVNIHIARHIANAHSLFNIFNSIVMLPFVGVLAKIASFIIPSKEGEEEYSIKYLDSKLLDTPILAISEARKEVVRMAEVCYSMYQSTVEFILNRDIKLLKKIYKGEEITDLLHKDITKFLVEIAQRSITEDISKEIASLMHMINDLERVGDHCENLGKLTEKLIDGKISISEEARNELKDIASVTMEFAESTKNEIAKWDKRYFEHARFLEERINKLEDTYRENHIKRLNDGRCTVSAGLIYVDMLTNFEKLGDHMINIAEEIAGINAK